VRAKQRKEPDDLEDRRRQDDKVRAPRRGEIVPTIEQDQFRRRLARADRELDRAADEP
jgi:hypothetical protein